VNDARSDSLEQLIERQLILHDFKTTFSKVEQQAAIEKMINKDIDQEIESEIKSHYGGSRVSLIQTLQAEGITMERHRQQIRDRLIVYLAAPEEYFFRDHRLAAPGGGVLPGAPR
jgi:hypothetical protein